MKPQTIIENYVDFETRRVGLEFENPITTLDGGVIEQQVIQNMYHQLLKKGWEGDLDPLFDKILYVDKKIGGRNVNISTDGGLPTLEIALPPQDTLHDASRLLSHVRAQVLDALSNESVRMLGLGMIPGYISTDDAYKTKKQANLFKEPLLMHSLFVPLNAHQVGISVKIDEAIAVLNTLLKLVGFSVALAGNSSINNFKHLPCKDVRMILWDYMALTETPESIKMTKMPERLFSSLADYYSYFWSKEYMPMIGPIRGSDFGRLDQNVGWLTYFRGTSWPGYFANGKRTIFTPESSDLNTAHINFWPHVKLRIVFDTAKIALSDFISSIERDDLENYLTDKYVNIYVEYRPCATAPINEELAHPAFILGLVENMKEFEPYMEQFSWDWCVGLVNHAAVFGIQSEYRDVKIDEHLSNLMDIANRGLLSRNLDEQKYLDPLYSSLSSGKNPADRMNELLKQGVDGFLDAVSYAK